MNDILKELYSITDVELKKITPYLDDIEPKLTKKQRKFAYFYVMNNFNGTEACMNSGYRYKKNGDANAFYRVVAVENLNKLNIKDAVQKIIQHAIKDKKEIEKELFTLMWHRANYDIKTFQNEDGTFKLLSEIPDEWRCCIDGVERKYYGKNADVCVVVSKLADRDKAIDKLDKYIKMTNDIQEEKNELTNETMKELLEMLHGKN
jgi:hypothetical protein